MQFTQYSEQYIKKINTALAFSKSLGIKNINSIDYSMPFTEKQISKLVDNVNGDLFTIIENTFANYHYWGNMCLDLSAHTYALLAALGYDVEMIFGNVSIGPDDENIFEVTQSSLKYEYENKINHGEQNVHAWVSVGADIIIDFGMPDRLMNRYNFPQMGSVFCHSASDLDKYLSIKYHPLLIGSDFFKVTNMYDPIALKQHYSK